MYLGSGKLNNEGGGTGSFGGGYLFKSIPSIAYMWVMMIKIKKKKKRE